jgi:hypothetical protein
MTKIVEIPAAAKAGRGMSAAPGTPMLSVYDGRACIGFILTRGRLGFEAYNADLNSLGFFQTQRAAANAISGARQ